jgi:hypothetical protein
LRKLFLFEPTTPDGTPSPSRGNDNPTR